MISKFCVGVVTRAQRNSWLPILVAGFLLGSSPVLAQTIPDAGSLLNKIERDVPTLVKPLDVPTRRVFPPEMPADNSIRVQVNSFSFVGNTHLTDKELQKATAEFLGRPLSFADLQRVVAAVAQRYRQAGWVVRVYLPKQEILQGAVQIQIVEALFGKLIRENSEMTRVPDAVVMKVLRKYLVESEPLHSDQLERALLLADDLPGVMVGGALKAGARTGETDLLIKLENEPLLGGDASVDNTGSRSTGVLRESLNASMASPFGFGDLFQSNIIHSDGNDYARLAFSMPAPLGVGRVGVNASTMNYRVISSEMRSLSLAGASETWGLEGSYPIVRSKLVNLNAVANYDKKLFDNTRAGAIQSRYQTSVVSLGVNGNYQDDWLGGGSNSAALTWSQGILDLGEINTGENRAIPENFTKYRLMVTRQQIVTNDVSLSMSWTAQFAQNQLDSSEKYYLGGNNGVRAFPISEGSGASGQIATMEVRWRLPSDVNLSAFYDHGEVKNKDISPSYALSGAGLAAQMTFAKTLTIKAMWSRRLNSNPNPTKSGNDQDGTFVKDRIWLSAVVAF